jgi:hypothetical protein
VRLRHDGQHGNQDEGQNRSSSRESIHELPSIVLGEKWTGRPERRGTVTCFVGICLVFFILVAGNSSTGVVKLHANETRQSFDQISSKTPGFEGWTDKLP